MNSTTQPAAHTPLPKLHRIHGEFSLMNSDTKEVFPLNHGAIDELCRRSNSHSSLVTLNEELVKSLFELLNASSTPMNKLRYPFLEKTRSDARAVLARAEAMKGCAL